MKNSSVYVLAPRGMTMFPHGEENLLQKRPGGDGASVSLARAEDGVSWSNCSRELERTVTDLTATEDWNAVSITIAPTQERYWIGAVTVIIIPRRAGNWCCSSRALLEVAGDQLRGGKFNR